MCTPTLQEHPARGKEDIKISDRVTERTSKYCKVFIEALKENVPADRIRLNDSGSEGCIVDVKNTVGIEGSSIWIDSKGNPSGELMVTHCKSWGAKETNMMFLMTTGQEICSGARQSGIDYEGCQIRQVHVHPFITPNKHDAFGSTHIHFECGDHPAKEHCLRRLAETIGKLDQYVSKTCSKKS